MIRVYLTLLTSALLVSACTGHQPAATMKEHFKNDFLIGAAISTRQVQGFESKSDSVITRHFNCIVAENCMKSEEINPAEGTYNWDDADAFVEYGLTNNMVIIGHTLVWHTQLAKWFLIDSFGNYVTPDVLKERMKNYITTVMGRYRGKIKGWDVVNEAILDDGSYRQSPFYEILGEEYIPLAFQFAHEADPEAELYLNDFSMAKPGKRDRYISIIKELQQRGLRIDGIGMQAHMGIDYPDMDEFEKSIIEFGKTGVNVMITEWDMSALPTIHEGADVGSTAEKIDSLNPYPNALPENVYKLWNNRITECLNMFRRHSDIISRVTLWGVSDGLSWRNDFPMVGRTDYPLAFDRNYNLKEAFSNEINNNR